MVVSVSIHPHFFPEACFARLPSDWNLLCKAVSGRHSKHENCVLNKNYFCQHIFSFRGFLSFGFVNSSWQRLLRFVLYQLSESLWMQLQVNFRQCRGLKSTIDSMSFQRPLDSSSILPKYLSRLLQVCILLLKNRVSGGASDIVLWYSYSKAWEFQP